MQFEASANPINKISADALLVLAFQDKKSFITNPTIELLAKDTQGLVSEVLATENFSGKADEVVVVHRSDKALAKRIYVLGLGKKEEFVANDLRKVVGGFIKRIGSKKITSLAVALLDDKTMDTALQSQMIGEGTLLGSYKFTKYKSKQEKEKGLEVVIFANVDKAMTAAVKDGYQKAQLYTAGTMLARDLINEPAREVTPTYLAKLAQSIAKKDAQIKCPVYGKEQVEKMGMGAFLGIAQAADTEPKFIHLEYTPKKSAKRKLAIVGKGITFDSGGINVKPGDHMQDMKMDMSGAAAVLGVFSVIAEIKPAFPVMGLIAATPNMISGSALVPGDVVKASNGKTIEVLNTDAEGRVTMADSLSYAVKEGATEIIDLATLTGACMVALGDEIAGLFGNNRDVVEKIKAAAHDAGELVWELPLPKEYKRLNKSDIADIANIPSSRYGGAITAALFLEEFVENKAWAHLDIAGPAFMNRPSELAPKGGTGFGVRLLLNYISSV